MLLLTAPCSALCESPWENSTTFEAWGYGNHQSIAGNSPINPGNSVLGVPQDPAFLDARMNVRVHQSGTELILQPRWLGQSKSTATDGGSVSEWSLRQAYARLQATDRSTVTAGRQVLTWGPANFRSPSNPFYFDSGKLNPLREVAGIDLAQYLLAAAPYSLTAGYVVGSSQHPDSDAADTAFAKLDYLGADYLLSANLAKTHGRKPFVGVFGQFNANDALMLYGEYGHGQRPSSLTLDPAGQPPFRIEQPSQAATSVLAGVSYTLLDGQAVALEYLHDGHGLSDPDQDAFFRILRSSADRATTSADPTARARQGSLLGLAASRSPNLLGRNYLSVLWQSNPQEAGQYWRLSASTNLHDGSGQASGYLEKSLTTRVSLFANVVRNFGPADSEFMSVVRSVVTLGLKVFVF